MAIFKCKMCGGDLTVTEADKVVECEYCGTSQTVPSADNEKKMTLFNRANRLRMNSEFDKAGVLFEQIVSEFPEEAEAYWGLCLCNWGIEYVDDPATGEKKPTCHRANFEKLVNDENYQRAMEYADIVAQRIYRREAQEIDRINEEILSVSRGEKPYDVFICYKETDENGGRTPDSVMAQDIYDALTAKGYKVFFARITLEDKLGQQYEPYIFAALNSAKVMLCVGTRYEYFHAVWVKNEWSRFLRLAAKDRSKILIPCYRDMDPYDMPDEFKGFQAQDLGKLGAVQDLIRGITKITGADSYSVSKRDLSSAEVASVAPLLKRASIFLEDKNWDGADTYAEKVLDSDPENAEAYLVKFCARHKVQSIETVKSINVSALEDPDLLKFLRYSEDPRRSEVKSIIDSAVDYEAREQKIRQTQAVYSDLMQKMDRQLSIDEYLEVADAFDRLDGYERSTEFSKICRDKAEWVRNNHGSIIISFLNNINEDGFRIYIDEIQYILEKPRSNTKNEIEVAAGNHSFSVGNGSGFRTKALQFSIQRNETVKFCVRSTFFSYGIRKE